MKRNTLGIACVGLSILVMAGFSQPEHPNARQETNTASQDENKPKDQRADRRKRALEIRVNPDALRDRLNRSILHAQQMIERSTAAITKLDEGASPSEVLSEMRLQGIARLGPRTANQRDNAQEQPVLGSPTEGENPPPMVRQGHSRPTISLEATDHFMEQNFPKLWESIELVRAADPRSAERLFGRMQPQIHEILLLTKSQPDLAKIKLQEMRAGLDFVEASGVYRRILKNPAASDTAKAQARETLYRLAGERFDAQMKSKLFEVQRLEARLNELKASVEDIESRRDVEIERMLKGSRRHAKHKNNDAKPAED